MRYDKGKQPEDSTWVHKALTKEAEFDLEHAHEALMEANKSFDEASTSGSKDKSELEMDPLCSNFLGNLYEVTV